MALTPEQTKALQDQLAAIQKQAQSIAGQVNTLAQAKAAGMTITPTTPVEQAQQYLSTPTASITPTSSVVNYSTPVTTQPTSSGNSSYTGVSVVDYLKSLGQPSDFNSRAQLAQQYGITNYSGTAEQNTQLLNLLRSGAKPASTTASTVTSTTTIPTTSTTTPTTTTDAVLSALQQQLGVTNTSTDYRQQMMDLINKLSTQQQQYVTALQNLPTAAEQYQTYREQLGLPAAEAQLTGTTQQIQKTQAMIDDLEKNINARISGRAITEPQRQRQLAVEQKPLAEQLQTLGRLATTQQTGVQSARDQLVQLLNLAQQEQQRQEAIAQAPLQYTQSLLPTLSSLLQYQSPEEKLAQQIQAEQSMKQLGLGDYYDKPSTVTPEVVGGQQTGYYQYDPTSQTWKQIISSAPSTSTTDTTGTPVKLTAAQKNTIDSLNKATVIADQIETAVNKLNLANSWLEVPIRYASLSTGALTKSNVDAVAYKSLVTGLLSQLARATGEVGVLTDQDIQRVKSLLPDFNDTKATAKAKLDQLRNFFGALKDSIAGTQTSTTTSGGSTDLGGLNFKLQ